MKAILGGAHPDVNDAVQQTLIGFVQGLPSFRGDCDPTGYGRVIAVRSAMHVRRRARARQTRSDDNVDTDAVPASHRDATDSVVHSERRKEIIRDLPATMSAIRSALLVLLAFVGGTVVRRASDPDPRPSPSVSARPDVVDAWRRSLPAR